MPDIEATVGAAIAATARPGLTSTPEQLATPESTSTPVPQATPTPETGLWEIYEEQDRLTGEVFRGVMLPAIWSDAEIPYDTTEDHVLVFSCASDEHISAILGYGGRYLGFDSARTSAAFDGGEVVNITWNISPGGEWLNNTNFNVYLRRYPWLESNRLVIRYSPEFSEPMTAEYDLSGIQWALNQLPCSLLPLPS